MRQLTYAEAINEAHRQAMELSEKVIVLGQLVDYKPGIFGTTRGLVEKFGKERVRDFPNAECLMTSAAIGSALTGYRPVIIHPRVDFALYSMDPIVNWLSLWRFKNNQTSNLPVTIRMIIGKGWGQGPQHSKSLHSWFAHLPGIRVAMPATPYDAKGLLLESIFGEVPSIIFENRALYSMVEEVPEEPYRVRFGQARVRRQGKDLSIVTSSVGVPLALTSAEKLAREGISCEVIDLRTVAPLDRETIQTSLQKTKRLMVVDFGWRHSGFAGEIIASVAEMSNVSLMSKPVRVTLPDSHTPMSASLEQEFYINEEDISHAARGLCGVRLSGVAENYAAQQ